MRLKASGQVSLALNAEREELTAFQNKPLSKSNWATKRSKQASTQSPVDSQFSFRSYAQNRGLVMKLNGIRRDIEYRRKQIYRQRKEILQLQRLGIPSASAEALLERMLTKIDELCVERDRLKAEEKVCYPGTTKEIRGTQRRGA